MLRVIGLTKRYGTIEALRDCTFSAARGRILGLLGPNGAGKTTAMRSIFGLVVPDGGHLSWNGHPIGPGERLRFGYMPEGRGLYPKMRVGEQLTYFARLHGLRRQDAEAAARRWLERLGLGDREESKLEELSHGNQQRVQLATALLHEPEMVVLDEPFSGLDPLAVDTLQQLVREEAERGTAVVFSSHQLDLVEDLCEDIAIISNGTVVRSGVLDELRREAGVRYLDLGFPAGQGDRTPAIEGAEVVARRDGAVRLRVPKDTSLAGLMAEVERNGPVEYIRFEPPGLSELFLEAVREQSP